MKTKLALFFLAITPIGFSQSTLLIYSGTFKEGKATYSYFEDENGERIYQGQFSYTGSFFSDDLYEGYHESDDMDILKFKGFPIVKTIQKMENGILAIYDEILENKEPFRNEILNLIGGEEPQGTITGSFNEGKKTGIWKCHFYNPDTYNDEVLSIEMQNDSVVKGTYTVKNTKYKTSVNSSIACEKIELSFNKLGFNGLYIHERSDSYKVNGNFVNGKMDGKWTIYDKYYSDEENSMFDEDTPSSEVTIIYKNGIQTEKKIKNLETGEIENYKK